LFVRIESLQLQAAAMSSSSTSSSLWRCLPEVTWHSIAACLPAPDVLSLLSTNRELRAAGQHSEALWITLLAAQFRHFSSAGGVENNDGGNNVEEVNRRVGPNDAAAPSDDGGLRRQRRRGREGEGPSLGDSTARRVRSRSWRSRRNSAMATTTAAVERRRQEYLALSYRQDLPAVEWVPLQVPAATAPSPREGHLSCVLADRYLVITGGYSTDTNVYVKDLRADPPQSDFHVLEPSYNDGQGGDDAGEGDVRPRQRPHFAYGASLTPINGRQAVQFGGFRAGGYSHECRQVAVLTLDVTSGADGGPRLSASWQVVTTSMTTTPQRLPGLDDREAAQRFEADTQRAYHTATLVFDRYLLILGGMQSSQSIWNPALLDTHTWRWTLPSEAVRTAIVRLEHCVLPRHGHTALWDSKRSRVVVFGGGTGNDLLRSGTDHADVWATTLPVDSWESLVRLLGVEYNDGPSAWTKIADASSGTLSPAESLCLGRCHVGHCIAPDTVLLAFGSGRPSTNGVLAFVRCILRRRLLAACSHQLSFCRVSHQLPPVRRIWQPTRSFDRESVVPCPALASPRPPFCGTRT
jgi:hypothetical protein